MVTMTGMEESLSKHWKDAAAWPSLGIIELKSGLVET